MDLTYIAEGLRPLAVPIDTLTPDPQNAKVHGRANLESIRQSLVRFGQVKPLAVRKADRVVIAGNGRLSVARALGWTHVAVVLMEGTPEQLAAFALVDNKSAELAEWDDAALADVMRGIGEARIDLAGLGWAAGELEALLDGDDPVPPPLPPPEEPADAAPEQPAPPPPRAKDAAPKAKAGKAAPAPQPAVPVTADEMAALVEAAAAVRAERDEPDMPLGAVVRVLARRYLKQRQAPDR